MNKKTIKFTFKVVNDSFLAIAYTATLEDGTFYTSGYSGVKVRNPLKNMREAKTKAKKAMWNLATKTFAWRGGVNMVCENPAVDFVKTREVAKSKPTKVTPSRSDERLYEVKNVSGTWTIIKHEEPLYTQEKAKTILFQRIVNE